LKWTRRQWDLRQLGDGVAGYRVWAA
jgi:hypothetical protein